MTIFATTARTLAAALLTFGVAAGALAQCHGGGYYGPSYNANYGDCHNGYCPPQPQPQYDAAYLKRVYLMLEADPRLAARHQALHVQLRAKFAPRQAVVQQTVVTQKTVIGDAPLAPAIPAVPAIRPAVAITPGPGTTAGPGIQAGPAITAGPAIGGPRPGVAPAPAGVLTNPTAAGVAPPPAPSAPPAALKAAETIPAPAAPAPPAELPAPPAGPAPEGAAEVQPEFPADLPTEAVTAEANQAADLSPILGLWQNVQEKADGTQEITQVELSADGAAKVSVNGQQTLEGKFELKDGNFNVIQGDNSTTLGQVVSAAKDKVVLRQGTAQVEFLRP